MKKISSFDWLFAQRWSRIWKGSSCCVFDLQQSEQPAAPLILIRWNSAVIQHFSVDLCQSQIDIGQTHFLRYFLRRTLKFKVFSSSLFFLQFVDSTCLSSLLDTFEHFPTMVQTEPVHLRGVSIFTRCFGALWWRHAPDPVKQIRRERSINLY